jgi:spoIIIJ-associated protein
MRGSENFDRDLQIPLHFMEELSMVREFEGKTESEAIEKAISELGLEREEFDVEVVEEGKQGLFKKEPTKIRIHIEDEEEDNAATALDPKDETESKLIQFTRECIEKMGYPGSVRINFREERKTGLEIESQFSGILIGKKGKNLDALQLIVNVYAGRLGSDKRIILDAEGYRVRREETLVRLARKAAEQVKRSGGSRLLEPMNPFERRLVHTSLNEMKDIDTKSEGEGLYKQVRIIYRG